METLVINVIGSDPVKCSNRKCSSMIQSLRDSVVVVRQGKKAVFCSSECLVETCIEGADRQIMKSEGKKRDLLKELKYKRHWGIPKGTADEKA